MIRKTRGHPDIGDDSPRVRRNPPLNWAATSLETLISWKDPKHEPNISCHIPTQHLRELMEDAPMQKPTWVSNTQAVERAIKSLTEAGHCVRGAEGRDGRVLAQMEGRKYLSRRINTKADLQTLKNIKKKGQ